MNNVRVIEVKGVILKYNGIPGDIQCIVKARRQLAIIGNFQIDWWLESKIVKIIEI